MTKGQKDCDCTPRLRFPEFVGGKKWRKISLGELADRNIRWSFSGGPFGSNLKSSDYTESGIRIIQLQNIGDSCFLDNYKIFTSKQKADELLSCNIYPGEIILAKMGDPVARSCIVPTTEERYLMCSDGIRLVVDKNNYSSTFTFYLINSKYFRKKAEEKSTGSTRKRIGLDELKSILILIPILQEQQKIARCLSSLDDLIEAHEQKLDALQRHKKGMMQRLFPAEGETTPRWRFPEFRNAGEWKKRLIKEHCHVITGGTPSRAKEDYWNGNIPWISSRHISDMHTILGNEYISKEGLENSSTNIIPKNSILLVTRVSVGKYTVTSFDIAINQDITALIPYDINYKFLFFYSEILAKMIKNSAVGTGVVGVSQNFFDRISIYCPNSLEQQKIADCLFAFDEHIKAQEEKIAALKEHKKGLMQQLFPSL